MSEKQQSILLVGLFLSEENKHLILRSSSDRLAELYQKHGINVIKASTKVSRLARLWDTASIIIKNRKNFDIAMVPLFGGLSLVLERPRGERAIRRSESAFRVGGFRHVRGRR